MQLLKYLKSSYFPTGYQNEVFEQQCNKKMAKALIIKANSGVFNKKKIFLLH